MSLKNYMFINCRDCATNEEMSFEIISLIIDAFSLRQQTTTNPVVAGSYFLSATGCTFQLLVSNFHNGFHVASYDAGYFVPTRRDACFDNKTNASI